MYSFSIFLNNEVDALFHNIKSVLSCSILWKNCLSVLPYIQWQWNGWELMEIEVVFSLHAHETVYYFLPMYCRLSSASLFPSLPNPRASDLSLKHSELTCFWDFLAPFPRSPASLIPVILKDLYVFTQVPLVKQNIKFLTVFLNILFKAFFSFTLLHILHTWHLPLGHV